MGTNKIFINKFFFGAEDPYRVERDLYKILIDPIPKNNKPEPGLITGLRIRIRVSNYGRIRILNIKI